MRIVRRHDDCAIAIVDGFHADEAAPFALIQIADGVSGLFSRIPHHGLRRTLFGNNDGAFQHRIAQLKRVSRIVDAVNHALEGHRFITLAATRIAIQYGIEIVRALKPAHLRLFGVANLQIRMQCLFVRQWLVAIVTYGKRHRQLSTDFNGVNGMKLRIRARNKLGKYVCVDLTRIQRVAQTSSGGPFLVIMPETVAGKTMLRCLRSHMAAFKTGIEPRENNGNAATDGSAFLKVNRLGRQTTGCSPTGAQESTCAP